MEELTIFSHNGVKLHGVHWEVRQPVGVICLVHGYAEHIGRYAHVAEHFNQNRFAVVGMDLQGHGNSQGQRGHIKNLATYMNDIEELVKTARAEYTDEPIFLFGQSMGGQLVLNYLLRATAREVSGGIASAPFMKAAFDPPAWKIKVATALSGIIPRLAQSTGLNPAHLSKMKEVVSAYRSDPLIFDRMSTRLYSVLLEGSEYLEKHVRELDYPALILHGDADKIADFDATRRIAEANPEMITWKPLTSVYHEPHNDEERGDVLAMLIDWLRRFV